MTRAFYHPPHTLLPPLYLQLRSLLTVHASHARTHFCIRVSAPHSGGPFPLDSGNDSDLTRDARPHLEQAVSSAPPLRTLPSHPALLVLPPPMTSCPSLNPFECAVYPPGRIRLFKLTRIIRVDVNSNPIRARRPHPLLPHPRFPAPLRRFSPLALSPSFRRRGMH